MRRAIAWVVGLSIVLGMCLVGSFGLSDFSRHDHRPLYASGDLKSIAGVEEILHERTGAYGDLKKLSEEKLIDPLLASGTKYGYAYVVSLSETHPESRWWGRAAPLKPEKGSRIFFVNQENKLHHLDYERPEDLALACDPDTCAIPSRAVKGR